MIRFVSAVIAGTIMLSTSAVASSGCKNMREARSIWPDSHLRYRLEGRRSGGRKCWYAGRHKPVLVREQPPRRDPAPQRDTASPQRDTAPSRIADVFDVLGFFITSPAIAEPVEDDMPVPRKRKRHHARIAQVPSVDERIGWLCGDLNHAYCNEQFRELARQRRKLEARP
jgi:hypothetical protein